MAGYRGPNGTVPAVPNAYDVRMSASPQTPTDRAISAERSALRRYATEHHADHDRTRPQLEPWCAWCRRRDLEHGAAIAHYLSPAEPGTPTACRHEEPATMTEYRQPCGHTAARIIPTRNGDLYECRTCGVVTVAEPDPEPCAPEPGPPSEHIEPEWYRVGGVY